MASGLGPARRVGLGPIVLIAVPCRIRPKHPSAQMLSRPAAAAVCDAPESSFGFASHLAHGRRQQSPSSGPGDCCSASTCRWRQGASSNTRSKERALGPPKAPERPLGWGTGPGVGAGTGQYYPMQNIAGCELTRAGH